MKRRGSRTPFLAGGLIGALLVAAMIANYFPRQALASSPPLSGIGPGWGFQMQNQQNTGFTPDNAINPSNVASMIPVWNISLKGLAGTPVVVDGVVYVDTGPGYVDAVDEQSGRLLWSDGPAAGTGLTFVTRAGVTVDQGSVFIGTVDNLLVKLDAATGAMQWSVNFTQGVTGNTGAYYGALATPLVFHGMVIAGAVEGDSAPTRGFMRAFNESTGALLWTFYVVPPGPITSSNQASYQNSWGANGSSGCSCGGGVVWNVPAVDEKSGIIYFGTGNPYPLDTTGAREPSLNYTDLYTESVVALNSTTGSLVWYYQEANPAYPTFDKDQGMPVQLFNTTLNGQRTEVVGAGGKAGYYFELDAASGALIYKVPVGIHLNEDLNASQITSSTVVYPGDNGGINSFSSYNPLTDMVYTIAYNQPNTCSPPSNGTIKCPSTKVASNSTLYAIDASTGTTAWSMNLTGEGRGVSSASGLVFFQDGVHDFMAANASTGAIAWEYYDPTGNSNASVGAGWSWGPPAILDGRVIWTTNGGGTAKGHLIAFGLPLTLSNSPSSGTVQAGSQFDVNLTVSGPVEAVTFSMPQTTGITAVFPNPGAGGPGGSINSAQIDVSASTPAGPYSIPITVTGSDGQSSTVTLSLQVVAGTQTQSTASQTSPGSQSLASVIAIAVFGAVLAIAVALVYYLTRREGAKRVGPAPATSDETP